MCHRTEIWIILWILLLSVELLIVRRKLNNLEKKGKEKA